MQKRALARLPPDEEERLIVHELWLKTKDIRNNQPPPGCVCVVGRDGKCSGKGVTRLGISR